MAMTQRSTATSADIVNFKSKILAEMKRRKYGAGPLNVSPNTGNFSVTAGKGYPIKIQHFRETIGLLDKIKSQGISGSQYNPIYALNAAYNRLVNTYSQRARLASTSDCGANCTGLCAGSCAGSCTQQCTNTCETGCNATCSGVNSMCDSCATGCMSECISYCLYSNLRVE